MHNFFDIIGGTKMAMILTVKTDHDEKITYARPAMDRSIGKRANVEI
jgi:hypothetical protein